MAWLAAGMIHIVAMPCGTGPLSRIQLRWLPKRGVAASMPPAASSFQCVREAMPLIDIAAFPATPR